MAMQSIRPIPVESSVCTQMLKNFGSGSQLSGNVSAATSAVSLAANGYIEPKKIPLIFGHIESRLPAATEKFSLQWIKVAIIFERACVDDVFVATRCLKYSVAAVSAK